MGLKGGATKRFARIKKLGLVCEEAAVFSGEMGAKVHEKYLKWDH
jgi:hypothetical protein